MKPSRIALAALSFAACMPPLPPPPDLQVTSPERGLIQDTGESTVRVTGRALPGSDGSPVYKVMVNEQVASVDSDGTFSVTIPTPEGAMLLRTVAISQDGGQAVDARAVHVGEIRQAGSQIPAAFSATLSAEAFGLISQAASNAINSLDVASMIPPISFGGGTANLKVTVSQLSVADVTIDLVPTDAGLQISVAIAGLSAKARAAYAGSLVPDGSTDITVAADTISFTGTLTVTPTETGFKTSVAAPNISSAGLNVDASGLAGTILDLLMNNLSGTIASIAKSSIGGVLDPALNKALGGLKAPRTIDVLGHSLTVAGSANDIRFSNAGALASLNLSTSLGMDQLPNYVYTANGQPDLELGHGIQLAVADDLINDMLAQVHALGLMNLTLEKDFEIFNKATLTMQMPPMVTANTADGTVKLILGDMILTATDGDKTLVRAAVNASAGVKVDSVDGAPDQIAVSMSEDGANVVINLLDDPQNPSQISAEELTGASTAGIAVHIKAMDQMLLTIPTPSFAGITLASPSLHGDSGYVLIGAGLHGTGTANH